MRLDKWLKVSRLIKRRSVAKEVCDAGRISVNGRVAKAGADIGVNDVLSFTYGGRRTEARVLLVAESMRADQCDSMYQIISEQRLNQDQEADQ